jgi:hypothetical protein
LKVKEPDLKLLGIQLETRHRRKNNSLESIN